MNILFFSDNFPPETNAAATRVYERACYWVKDGHDVTVITCAPNFPQGKLFEGYQNRWHQVDHLDGIRVVRVKTFISANRGTLLRLLDFLSYMVTGFTAGLFERRPDVIVSTSPQFFAAVAGWALAAVRRVPFVFELGDLWPASISAVGAMRPGMGLRMIEKLELFLYRRAACVIALTQAFKDNLIRRGIPADKISVVINGVDLWRYGPRERDQQLADQWGLSDKFVVGYVGTHGMAHALGNVINCAEILKDQDHIRFLFAGAGAERDALMADASRRGLENVVFMPSQPKQNMPSVWSLCDVALVHLKDSPAFKDVIPSKIFEAMGMGLPVVLAAPEGEASAIVNDDRAGLHVPAEKPEALAKAARNLAEHPELCQQYAKDSLAAAPRHGRDIQARHMIEALKAVITGQGDQVGRMAIPTPEDFS